LVFRALGDQREALLPYLIMLSESVLGPTDRAVRLPTALAGVALVGALFLLGRELYGSRAGLLAALLLALSPWHVQVSRLAFRTGLLPLTTVVGLWLLLVACRRPALMLPAGMLLGLGLHTYLAARVFLPLLLIGVVVIHRSWLFRAAPATRGPLRLWSIPLARLLCGVGLVAAPLLLWGATHRAEFAGHALDSAGSGEPARQALDALGRYVAYFGPRHLLTQGDPYPVPSTGRFGALYWPVLPLFVGGLAWLLARRSRADQLVLWWLVIYPIPAALTRGAHPDWLRAACGIGSLELVSAVGFTATGAWLVRHAGTAVAWAGALILAVAIAVNAGLFVWDYTQRFPARAAPAFNDGVAVAMRRLSAREPFFDRTVLPANVAAIHDLYLFYTRYEPARLQTERLEDLAAPGAWADVRGFGRHRVCDPVLCCGAGDLCLVRGVWQGTGVVLDEVTGRDGHVAFTIVAGGP